MEYYTGDVNMGCSINIIRKNSAVHEVKYVPDKEMGEIYGEVEALERARRAIVQHIAEQELEKEMEE